MTPIERKTSADPIGAAASAGTMNRNERAAALAPPPDAPVPTDDLQTALAVLMIQALKEQRSMSDSERAIAAKTQEEAHGRKIEKMREIAAETFAQAIGDGVCQMASAALQARSAVVGYDGAVADLESKKAKTFDVANDAAARAATLTRNAKILDAASRAVSGAGAIGSGAAKSAIEYDRADVAVIERELDRAKSSVEGFATDSKRAQDDIRETMGFVRQYLATKAQLNQASIIRG